MKTKTHIQQVRDNMQSSHISFHNWLGISQEDYAHMVYNWGTLFLHHMYPKNSRQFAEYHIKLESSKAFWNWFKSEVYQIEKALIRFASDGEKSNRHGHHHNAMNSTLTSESVESSFITFIKTQKNFL